MMEVSDTWHAPRALSAAGREHAIRYDAAAPPRAHSYCCVVGAELPLLTPLILSLRCRQLQHYAHLRHRMSRIIFSNLLNLGTLWVRPYEYPASVPVLVRTGSAVRTSTYRDTQ